MTWGLVAVAGASVIGGAISASGASSAANAQENAANNADATQLSMFNSTKASEAPWVSAGQNASAALSQFYGLPAANSTPTYGQTTAATQPPPDYSSILSNLPGYQFQLQQGIQATDRGLAASGLFQSGAGAQALTNYGQGLAQNYAGQYAAGLSGISATGQAAASNVGVASGNAANQIGSNQIYAGNAAAAGIAGQTNAITGGLSGVANAYGYFNSPQYQQQTTPLQDQSAMNTYNSNNQGGLYQSGGYAYNLP